MKNGEDILISIKSSIPGNSALIRDINRCGVMDTIRKNGPITQSSLAQILNLQPSTILNIINELEEKGWIKESGKSVSGSRGGRRAKLFELNEVGAFAIGVDFEADNIIASLVGLTGNHVGNIKVATPSQSSSEVILEFLADTIEQLMKQYPQYQDRILGIGVALPGRVDSESGMSIYATNFKTWRNVNVSDYLYQKFNIPVKIEHSLSLMALGEMWYGESAANMVCLGFRQGIGLGIVMNGMIYRGAHHFAGEVGHIKVKDNGKLCRCGGTGCLETVASEWAMLDMLNSELDGDEKHRSLEDLYAAFKDGNPELKQFTGEAAYHIAKVLSDIVRVFDPEKIILSGEILYAYPEFKDLIEREFKALLPSYLEEAATIHIAKSGQYSISIGASVLILSELFTL